MNLPTLFVFFVIAALYILEPNLFRLLPEAVTLVFKMAHLGMRREIMKFKLKRQLDKDIKEMTKSMEEFTKK
jgi:hypothetical protein